MQDKEIKDKLEKGLTVCLKCGYSGEDLQGEYPDLYKGYGCPKCQSTLVVKYSKKLPKDKWLTLRDSIEGRIKDLIEEQNEWIKKYGFSNSQIDSALNTLLSIQRLMIDLEKTIPTI